MPAFLFTDIESSTRLWEEHPAEMEEALARHDVIMRAAIAAAQGRLLKTTGDGAIALFESPAHAIRASIEAQEALHAEPWDSTPIRVRMGIHAGETQSRDDDHFGPVMNRTARIMAAGHGGQILVSETARDLANTALREAASFQDLGAHRLKDLTEPEHLYQLVAPGLRSDFPALKTLDSRPNNLPLQTTEFLGRNQELAAIHLMLDNPATRLLTITGPGGAGKTRLGLQVAADLVDTYRDGVWFVDLSSDTTPDDAFETVIRVLALPVSRTGVPLNVLANRLRDRELLLVLDNFEQVVDAGPGLVELMRSAPRLELVVTSRETLRVRGETVYPVPPLSLPHPRGSLHEIAESEAVQLFVDRATAGRPAFALTDDNAGDIAAICLRLDGLPLAIELAAARLTVFAPADLLARLTDRLDVLASGGRDLPDRQRTLWGAIGWSHELLDDDERALFELMAVFAGADVDALEHVAADALGDGFIVDTLSSLVDKSLVRRIETAAGLRFTMLQMIKEYATDELTRDPDRMQTVVAAHAEHYASVAGAALPHLDGPDGDKTLLALEADLDNLRTAWKHWVGRADATQLGHMFDGLWRLHTARGWYHGAIDVAGQFLGVLEQTQPSEERDAVELTLRVNMARALMAVHGYNLESEQAFSRALQLAETAGTDQDQVPVLRALASYHLQTGDAAKSAEIGQRLLEMGRELGDEAIEIEAHSVLGNANLYFDPTTSLEHLGGVIERYDPTLHRAGHYRLGPDDGVVARIGSAIMLWETGRLDTAVATADDALAFATTLDHPYSLTWVLYHCGFLAVARGRFDDVLELSQRLAAIADEHDYPLWRTLATVLEGVARTALGDSERGVALTEEGVKLYRGLAPPPIFWPLVLELRARVHATAGDPQRALELIDEATRIWETNGGVPPGLMVHRSDLLMTVAPTSRPEAERLLEQSIEVAQHLGMRLSELEARTRLVAMRHEQGRADDGAAELAALYESLGEGYDEAAPLAARRLLASG